LAGEEYQELQDTAALDEFCTYLKNKGVGHLKVSAAQRTGIEAFLDSLVELLARKEE
jgi:hypothetical protein